MMHDALKLAFLRVLAAVAWADGVVEVEERNRIKILFNGFGLDAADRREIDDLLERPVEFERALELTKSFASHVAPPGARRKLLLQIEEMLGDESARAPEESELLEHVRAILASHTVVDGFVEKLRGVFSETLFAGGGHGAGKRAGDLTDRARDAALARLEVRFAERGWTLDDRAGDWNRATLAGVLLAHVGRVDGRWDRDEREVVARALTESYGLDEAAIEVALNVMDEEAAVGADLQRLCSETCRVMSMEERLATLEVLFQVAAADGRASREEVEEIRRIADLLWISRPEYLAVRDRHRDRIEP